MKSLLIKGGTVIKGADAKKNDVYIEDGSIAKHRDSPGKVINAEGLFLLPGLIDCHVHFRDPGLTHKESMESGAASARAGGITTVCDMPNTTPPTVTQKVFEDKERQTRKIKGCDIRLFFGIAKAMHLEELKKFWAHGKDVRKKCCGVKLYLEQSTGDQKADAGVIEDVFQLCKKLELPITAHCEDPTLNKQAGEAVTDTSINAHSIKRPPESEAKSIEYAIGLAAKHGTRLHVAHLSTMQGVELIRQAKKDGLSVTCEAAPHHLFLSTEDYENLGTLGKMNPPLRPGEHREALWGGIEDGTIDCIASDHAPHLLEEKNEGQPLSAPSGVPGVETIVPLLLTVAAGGWPNPVGRRVPTRLGYNDIVTLCFGNPNEIFKLGKRGITEKAPADITIIDPKAEWIIKGEELHSKCGWTPYEGWRVVGRVLNVI